jgi:uncharacterized membrane protein
MKTLVRNFVRGCLIVVPVVATLYAVYFVVGTLDGLLGLRIPGLGLVISIALITAVGTFASNMVGARLLELPDKLFGHIPFVKLIYTSLRDFMAALVGERRSFDRPVVVSLGGESDLRVFGFITRDDLTAFGLRDHVAVYLPQSINFAGQLLLVPRERVQPVDVPASTILPVIVSGGMAGGTVSQA